MQDTSSRKTTYMFKKILVPLYMTHVMYIVQCTYRQSICSDLESYLLAGTARCCVDSLSSRGNVEQVPLDPRTSIHLQYLAKEQITRLNFSIYLPTNGFLRIKNLTIWYPNYLGGILRRLLKIFKYFEKFFENIQIFCEDY